MSNQHHNRSRSDRSRHRRVVAVGIRRDHIDTRKLARALIAMARAKADAEAQAEHEARLNIDHSETGDTAEDQG